MSSGMPWCLTSWSGGSFKYCAWDDGKYIIKAELKVLSCTRSYLRMVSSCSGVQGTFFKPVECLTPNLCHQVGSFLENAKEKGVGPVGGGFACLNSRPQAMLGCLKIQNNGLVLIFDTHFYTFSQRNLESWDHLIGFWLRKRISFDQRSKVVWRSRGKSSWGFI